jgi:hypothetical protein
MEPELMIKIGDRQCTDVAVLFAKRVAMILLNLFWVLKIALNALMDTL